MVTREEVYAETMAALASMDEAQKQAMDRLMTATMMAGFQLRTWDARPRRLCQIDADIRNRVAATDGVRERRAALRVVGGHDA